MEKIKTPKQIIQKYHGTKGLEPMMLTLEVNEIIELINAYHAQFQQQETDDVKKLAIKYATANYPKDGGKSGSSNAYFINCARDFSAGYGVAKSHASDNWISVTDKLPPDGVEVIGYSKDWIHPDFNTEGTRVCWVDGEGEWQSAKWDNDNDSWHTHAKWCCEESGGTDFNPTHWKTKPTPPKP